MKVVVAAGVLSALMASQPGIPAFLLLATGYAVPISVAAWRRRHLTAALIAAALPTSSIGCLYATWMIAWVAVGHRPVTTLDDPESIGSPIINVLVCSYALSVLGFFVGPFAGLMLGIDRRIAAVDRRTLIAGDLIAILLTPALIWATITILRWDPLRVGDWIKD